MSTAGFVAPAPSMLTPPPSSPAHRRRGQFGFGFGGLDAKQVCDLGGSFGAGGHVPGFFSRWSGIYEQVLQQRYGLEAQPFSTLIYLLDRMLEAYRIVYLKKQVMGLFTAEKDAARSWNDHLVYLELKGVLMARYNPLRLDYLVQREEMVFSAQAIQGESKADKNTGKELVNEITETRRDYKCNDAGHPAG
ncbi:hypothetical protein PybrP1_011548 [[Pythium] brassicae (nom. inval.)]|nr:hypothetical protein PybrP1_011548 [[Pythium] brassicae (nom. inval.)]